MSVELVDRYLQAVRMLLPMKQRHDVDRELADELQSQIEAKESGLGRALTEDEVATLLRTFGHPALLALRYQEGRSLIGPRVFPLYWFSVQATVGILAIVHLLLPTLFFVTTGEPGLEILKLFTRFPGILMVALAWLTLVFVVLDTDVVRTAVEKALADWNPRRDLPALHRDKPAAPAAPSVFGVLLMALGSAWWLAGLQKPALILGPAAQSIAFGPIFHRLYVPMAVLAVAGIVLALLRILKPAAAWHAAAQFAIDAANLVVLYILAHADTWFVAASGARAAGAEILELVNMALSLGLGVAFVVTACVFAVKWAKAVRLGSAAPRHLAC